jgi:DNA-directed RNA polymerase subunit RPC12/RpoP
MIIRVRCPHCGFEMNTSTVKTVKCIRCNRSFEVFPLDLKGNFRRSRVVGIVDGSLEEVRKLAYQKLKRRL